MRHLEACCGWYALRILGIVVVLSSLAAYVASAFQVPGDRFQCATQLSHFQAFILCFLVRCSFRGAIGAPRNPTWGWQPYRLDFIKIRTTAGASAARPAAKTSKNASTGSANVSGWLYQTRKNPPTGSNRRGLHTGEHGHDVTPGSPRPQMAAAILLKPI
ncbi:hypothetical protein M8818_004779 [Zalaria obscura]|uniref:Uncharacterized protein n=1 Tax=Zalaria obscura TaxID=2024903 RepID=A0ACC3SAI6_9PEZI